MGDVVPGGRPRETTGIAARHKVVLIKIPRTAPASADARALYEAVRQWWRLAAARTDGGASSPTHALAVVDGTVAASFIIESWQQRPEDSRRGFIGHLAEDETAAYVGIDVRSYFPRGAANPLRFVHCGPDSTGADAGGPPARVVVVKRSEQGIREQVTALVAQIQDEPLAHLMFGHRELFHSNLLGWFVEALPTAADHVFGAGLLSGTGTERRVHRERDHLDLAIRLPGRQLLAIENKVFAVYDHDQLDRNAKAVSRWKEVAEPPALVLLSMLSPLDDPAWAGGTYSSPHGQWTYLSYDELGRRISAALEDAPDTYDVATMRRYARLVRTLHALVHLVAVRSAEEPVDLPFGVVEALGDRRLAETLKKLRFRSIAHELEAALTARGLEGQVRAGYSHGIPLLEWFTDLVDEDGEQVSVGWQLQDGDFGRCLVLAHLAGKSTESQQQRLDYATAHPHLFDFTVSDAHLGTADVRSAPKAKDGHPQGFKGFNPNFVYRTKRVSNLTVRQLLDATTAIAASLR